MNTITNTIQRGVLGLLTISLLFIGSAMPVDAQTECTFTRTLKEGIEGEDVRCLQKFLNNSGYTIAASGAGSPGKETDEFKTLTKEAVLRWQEANGLMVDGYFGPLSQAKYKAKIKGETTTPGIDTDLIKDYVDSVIKTPTVTTSQAEEDAIVAMKAALKVLKDVENAISEADKNDQNTSAAEANFINAAKDMFDAMRYYFDGNYAKAEFEAEDGQENALTAFEETGREDLENAKQALDDIQDMFDDAEDDIDEAKDDGADVESAEQFLDEADEYIDLAEDAYDDGEYDDALDYIDDAEDKIEDALETIDENEEQEEAQEEIEDAQDELEDAEDEVEEADGDGEDVDDAEELLEEAEELIDEAEDAYDDGDYDDAKELAEEAKELIEEALDEL